MKRTFGAVAVTALVLAALPAISEAGESSQRPRKPRVSLSAPSSVVEGDRFTVVVKIGRDEGAKVVQLEQQVSVHGNVSWQTVGKARVKKKKKYQFRAVGGEADTVVLRARVVYSKGRPATSDPLTTSVWHWLTLGSFDPYSHTTGVNDNGITAFTLNGLSLRGWFTTGSAKSWESRFTLGRHCQAMRGLAGVRDDSADGSSAQVRLLADDVLVFASSTLSPGTSQQFQVALATPFRLAVQASNTSLTPVTVYPAIANPQLLCTGLA